MKTFDGKKLALKAEVEEVYNNRLYIYIFKIYFINIKNNIKDVDRKRQKFHSG